MTLLLPGTPLNPYLGSTITEAFLFDGERLIQLTNFRRTDTNSAFLDVRTRRALLTASADPFGLNPSQSCQFFSVDTLGRSAMPAAPATAVAPMEHGNSPLHGSYAPDQDRLTEILGPRPVAAEPLRARHAV